MGSRELRQAFEARAESGRVSLVIRSENSDKTRTIELQFTDPPEPPPESSRNWSQIDALLRAKLKRRGLISVPRT